MSNPRFPEEFKIQAVNQVTEKRLPVADVDSLYAWIKRYTGADAHARHEGNPSHLYVRTYVTSQFADLNAAVYGFRPNHAGEHARNFPQGWNSVLICDGFGG